MTYTEIAALLGVKVATLRQWVRRGKFPQPDERPHTQAPLWREETVRAWMESR